MSRSGALVVMFLGFLGLLIASPHGVSAITCSQVDSYLSPCINYGRNGGTIPPECCKGVSGLNGAATTTPDRQQACSCMKTASAGISGLKPGLVAGIPSKCGVNIPYQISPTTDCSKVK